MWAVRSMHFLSSAGFLFFAIDFGRFAIVTRDPLTAIAAIVSAICGGVMMALWIAEGVVGRKGAYQDGNE